MHALDVFSPYKENQTDTVPSISKRIFFVYAIDCLTESCDENIFPWTSVLQKENFWNNYIS